ncbi:MAG: collagen-like protein [Parcubacteria group bacterium]|nr:collagen-like protein [Parcubacteria group bacterium]
MRPSFLRHQLLIISAVGICVSVVIGWQTVIAAPTQNPPAANPTFPTGPQGIKGPTGSAGGQGVKGDTGSVGPKGYVGLAGYATCNWGGELFLNHGWDGVSGCLGKRGIKVFCGSSTTYDFRLLSVCASGI